MDHVNDYNLFYYTKRTVKWNGIINDLVFPWGDDLGDDDEWSHIETDIMLRSFRKLYYKCYALIEARLEYDCVKFEGYVKVILVKCSHFLFRRAYIN